MLPLVNYAKYEGTGVVTLQKIYLTHIWNGENHTVLMDVNIAKWNAFNSIG